MVGVSMSDPKLPSWANPVSSRSTTTTFGDPTGFGLDGKLGVDSPTVRPMVPRRSFATCPPSLDRGWASCRLDMGARRDYGVIRGMGLRDGTGVRGPPPVDAGVHRRRAR